MIKIKFDNTRKELKVKDGRKKPVKAQYLDYFVQQNTFDKHESRYFNHKGLTYILTNPSDDENEEIFFPVEFKYQDTDLQKRLFAMKSPQEIEEIAKIKEDYAQ